MRRYLEFLIALFIFSFQSVSAQTLEEACKSAKKENKIIMLVVASEKCTQCNEVASQGLSSEIAKRAINASAVIVNVSKIPEELNGPYTVYYFPAEFFGVIYLDADKNVLTVYQGSSTFYKSYLDNLEKAIKEKENGTGSMSKLIADYYGKKSNFETAYMLVEKIIKSGLDPKQEIIDDITQNAPLDSANSLTFLQFVERTAPEFASASQQYVSKNQDNFNMSWYRMSLAERVNINNRSYQKSLRKAIAIKDMNYMFSVSYSRMNMFQSSGPQVMQRTQQEAMLQYYKGVKDTNNYLMNASRFYDTYFMNIRVDSIAKVDSARKAGLFKIPDNIAKQGGIMVSPPTVSFVPVAFYYGNALNEGAWTAYTYSKNPQYLIKALGWAKRANEFVETPELMDTYARILYKTHNRDVAIEWETKAVALNKIRKFSSLEYEKVLEAMKKGIDKIDEY